MKRIVVNDRAKQIAAGAYRTATFLGVTAVGFGVDNVVHTVDAGSGKAEGDKCHKRR